MGGVGFLNAAVATHLPRNPRICVLTYIYIHIHMYIYGICIWDMYMGGVGSLNSAVVTHLSRNPPICAYNVCEYLYICIYTCVRT